MNISSERVEKAKETRKKVLEFLKEKPQYIEFLAKELEVTERTIYRALQDIQRDKDLEVVRFGSQNFYKYMVYEKEDV